MWQRIAALSMMSCVAAIAAAPQQRGAAPNPRPAAGVWLDVPFLRQSEEGCGAASIAMVMRYWEGHGGAPAGATADPEQIQKKLFSPKAHGIFASAMEKYLRESGFDVFALAGQWDDLREHLAKGRPLIVGLKPRQNKTALHYVVVVGLDGGLNGGEDEKTPAVLINDPARGKLLRVERAEFEAEWSAVHHWMLLALPHAAAKTAAGSAR